MPDPVIPSVDAGASPDAGAKPLDGLANLGDELDRSLRDVFKNENVPVDEHETPPDPTPEPKKAVEEEKKPAEETVKPITEQKKPDDEKPVDPETIQPPAKMSQQALAGWNVLKKNSTRAWNALKAATEENKKLQLALGERATMTNGEIDKLKKENEDLRGYRAMVDYEHDPEFIEKYEGPAAAVKKQMVEMLKGLQVRQDVIDGIDFTDSGVIARVAAVLEEKADRVSANRFLKRGEEYIDLWEKRENSLTEHKGKHKEFAEERRKKAELGSVEESARMTKHVETVSAMKSEDGNPAYPFLSKREPAPGAKKDEIAQIDAHNKMVDGMQEKLQKVMKVNTPEERAELAIAAVAASFLMQNLKAATEKIKSLEDTLKKYNDLSSERKGGGGDGAYKVPKSLDLDDSISQAFPGMK